MKLSFALALTNLLSCATTVTVVCKVWQHASRHQTPGPTRRYLQQDGTSSEQQRDQSTSSNCSSACCTTLEGPTSCTLLRAEVSFENGQQEELVACELPNNKIVEVTWLPENLAAVFESGRSILEASDIVIEGNELRVPKGSTYEVTGGGNSSPASRRRLAVTIGKKKVLVIREGRTIFDEATLDDTIFRSGSDVVNLASQYAACSYQQLVFDKYTAKNLFSDGILTVTIPNPSLAGTSTSIIREAMTSQAVAALGEPLPPSGVNYIILCMPFGTSISKTGGDKWIGYGYVNHYLSILNDQWCNSPSLLMHEIGHNLGLAHAREQSSGNYDGSGMMGYSFDQDAGPKMCFNGPKTYQLGWFPQYHLDLTASGSSGTIFWTGNLIGFAEKPVDDRDRDNDKMIIKITGGSSGDYYVHFNRKTGINADTNEGETRCLFHGAVLVTIMLLKSPGLKHS